MFVAGLTECNGGFRVDGLSTPHPWSRSADTPVDKACACVLARFFYAGGMRQSIVVKSFIIIVAGVAVLGGAVSVGLFHGTQAQGDTEPVQIAGEDAVAFGMLITAFSAAAQTITIPSANPNSPTYPSPLDPKIKGLPDLIVLILTYIQSIAIPLAIIAIVIVGIQFIYGAATGNQGLISRSRTLLLWILIGTAIVIGAMYLATAMVDLLKNVGRTGTYTPPSGGA